MGLEAGSWKAALARAPRLGLGEASPLLCGPGAAACPWLARLREAGVERVVSIGNRCMPGVGCILGRGWAGSVFIAETSRWGIVAVKMLHPGSRRATMLGEALAWAAAAAAAAAPRLLHADRYFIVYEPVLGPTIDEYTPRTKAEAAAVLAALIDKAYLLDAAGVRHGELARPGDHVVLDEDTLEPYIIDYDSATFNPRPLNLTQLLGGLHRVPWLRGCSAPRLRSLLREYKERPEPTTLKRVKLAVLNNCIP